METFVKPLILILFLTYTYKSIAQKYTLNGGFNLSKYYFSDTDINSSVKFSSGFHLGLKRGFKLTNDLNFEAGILFTRKGSKFQEKNVGFGVPYESRNTENLFYIDIPLTIKPYFPIGNTKMYGIFGPYMGIGLFGKGTNKNVISANSKVVNNYDVKWGNDTYEIRRFDYGLVLGTGIEYKSIQFGLSHSLGFANLSNISGYDFRYFNRLFQISLGCILKKE